MPKLYWSNWITGGVRSTIDVIQIQSLNNKLYQVYARR